MSWGDGGVFCWPEDTEGLVGTCTTDPEKSCKEESSLELTTNSISSQLELSRIGQYFGSKDNVKHVVQTAMDKMKLLVPTETPHGASPRNCPPNFGWYPTLPNGPLWRFEVL
jgi:hypothetical protein